MRGTTTLRVHTAFITSPLGGNKW